MLTGDNASVASSVGRQLGIDRQFANTLPADKAAMIQGLRAELCGPSSSPAHWLFLPWTP
jgi:cation transport ATPase